MEATIYNTKGKEAGKITLDEKVWGLPWNADLVYQIAESMRANARVGTANAKDRGEVSGGGRKPWQQKGTGRARHGSSRSPIWRHGGVTHGPLAAKDYSKKINKKASAKALYVILSEKLRRHELMFIDDIALKEPKTKEAKTILGALAGVKGFERLLTKKKNAAYVTIALKSPAVVKSFSNFANIDLDDVKNMNPLDLLSHKYVLVVSPAASIKFIEGKLNK